jgi:hypothetical protein
LLLAAAAVPEEVVVAVLVAAVCFTEVHQLHPKLHILWLLVLAALLPQQVAQLVQQVLIQRDLVQRQMVAVLAQ